MTAIRNNTSPSSAETSDAGEALRAWAQAHKGILDVFLDAYCLVDASNRVVDFNVAFTELCGESYRKILKIGDRTQLIKLDVEAEREIRDTLKPLRLDEVSGSTKAYPELRLIVGGVPVLKSDGTFLGSLITIRNVSAESELQKKYDQRKQESVIDGLTRLYNKVYAESMLMRLVKGALRGEHALSVVICDIDHFKKVNDTYGHPAGDHVLSTVAQMLKGESRETDIVGRFGGEEFIAILAFTDRAGSLVFTERFRKRVASAQILFEGKHIPLTVSLGTATFHDTWRNGMSPEACLKELVARADTALYYAKAHGRNQSRQIESITKDDEKKGTKG